MLAVICYLTLTFCCLHKPLTVLHIVSFQSDACIPKRFRVPDFERFKGSEIFAHNLPDVSGTIELKIFLFKLCSILSSFQLQVIYHHVPQDETDNSILNITKECEQKFMHVIIVQKECHTNAHNNILNDI